MVFNQPWSKLIWNFMYCIFLTVNVQINKINIQQDKIQLLIYKTIY